LLLSAPIGTAPTAETARRKTAATRGAAWFIITEPARATPGEERRAERGSEGRRVVKDLLFATFPTQEKSCAQKFM
jgi:hypothetical protein